MRLTVLDNGHRTRVRQFFALTKLMSKVDMSDVPKTLLYRPELFGRALLEHSARAMRGPSFWTAGEREYIAMRTAEWHRCPYCAVSHTELVRIAGAGEIDAHDPDSARPELRTVLVLLEKVSRTPEAVSASDVDLASVPEPAIVEALHVNLVWNIVNRLANAFDFQLRPGQLEKGTRSLHRFGYRFPNFLTGNRRGSDPIAELRQLQPTVAAPLREYAATVRDASFSVTDADIAALIAAGHTEDELFEVTAAAAVSAALTSLDAGLRALRIAAEMSPG
jgi:AhpD family alkylhydroperoxidase